MLAADAHFVPHDDPAVLKLARHLSTTVSTVPFFQKDFRVYRSPPECV